MLLSLKFFLANSNASKLISVAVTFLVNFEAYMATIPDPVPISKTLWSFSIKRFSASI